MDPYTQSLIAGFQAQQQLLQQQITALQQKLEEMKAAGITSRGLEVDWPLAFRQGPLKYPGKDPFPFFHVVEMKVSQDSTWGETINEAQGAVTVDRTAETFVTRISAYQYQTDYAAEQPPPYAVGYLRPLASTGFCKPVSDACESLLDFEFQVKFGDEDVLMQQNWLPSSLLQNNQDNLGLLLPIEKEITQYENVNLTARPLRAAGEGNKFRLFFILHAYKMLPRVRA